MRALVELHGGRVQIDSALGEVIEGMAAGCVPVASDLPGVRDIASPTGLVVPATLGALRAALRGLAQDTARLERLQRASRLAAQALTWDRCVTPPMRGS